MPPPTMRGMATDRSASSHTIAADLPPSSSDTRVTRSAQRAMIRLPASVEPVNATLSMPGMRHEVLAGLAVRPG